MEAEEDEEEEIEAEDNVDDDAEVINPYEEVDPLNRPPPGSNEKSEFVPPAILVVDDDRYAIVRDAVTSDVRDDGDDPSVPSDPNHHSHVNLPVIISSLVSLVVAFCYVVTPLNFVGSGILNIRGCYFIDQ
nr:hypothetical protein [Tanacetum cinerariifolium]GFB06644.1 hypothetical protein [Tanacetum cinerariifolium]